MKYLLGNISSTSFEITLNLNFKLFEKLKNSNDKKNGKTQKKMLKIRKIQKVTHDGRKTRNRIPQKISHKDFFSKLKFIQFLLKLGYNSSLMKCENLYL